jgi:DNA polymerase-3 subunit alpha
MDTVAITDRGQMCCAVDFQKKAKKAGIKPIFGVDLPFAVHADGTLGASRLARPPKPNTRQLVLLARDQGGYANLRELGSMAWLEGNHQGPQADLELLQQHSGGLIGLSGGLDGIIAQLILAGQMDAAQQAASDLKSIFEPGAFYLEVLATKTPRQTQVNAALRDIGTALDIPLVATNDCKYMDRNEARAHEVLECIRLGYTLDSRKRPEAETDQYYFKQPAEMYDALGADFADALANTRVIADACSLELTLGKIYLPTFEVPKEHDIESYLRHCSQTGLEERYAEFDALGLTYDKPEYQARLDIELGIIEQMGFPGYFLIVMDFIQWAKDQDIPVGPGRGSGAGSLVAYALRITDIDPLPYGLLFERFLNPERVSMPDFDIDFCMNRRGEVIQYVTDKYGAKNVGQIATYGSLKAKGVIKDVGRVLGLSYGETDRLSKLVPDVLGITLDQALEQEPRLREMAAEEAKIKDLLDIARSLEGLHRNFGMHAAGVVIGDEPLWEYCPVFLGANDERVTQFAKDEVEEAGLVKFDFLGLKTLTVIDVAVRLINRTRGPDEQIDMAQLPLTDPKVYELIGRGDTEGVFQLESSGFQEMLKKLKPDCFEDIVAAVALYRPGPMGSGMHFDFIDRKHGKQEVSYPHDCLIPVLKDTYGVIVYQEQVMQIAQIMAGYSLGGADLLRRAMGKKKMDVMAQQRIVFCDGAVANEVPKKTATEVFDLMETFAQYGFNKSHSAAYALLTYHTGWLKTFYPVEFTASLLTNDRDNADKVSKIIRNAQKIGVEVLPPDVNRSGVDFDAVIDEDGEKKVLFGMAGVKGVGGSAVEAIVEAREDGPFTSLFDFCERVDLRRANKKTLEALVRAGAFDCFEHPRARLEAALDTAIGRGQSTQRDKETGQGDMFSMFTTQAAFSARKSADFPSEIAAIEEWPVQDLLAHEKSVLGFYVSGHPLDRFAEVIRRSGATAIENLERRENYDTLKIAGIINSIRVRPFKNGNGRMAIMLVEDHSGSTEVIAMGAEFDRHEALLAAEQPVLLTGTLRKNVDDDGDVSVSLRLGKGRRRNQEQDPNEIFVELLDDIRAKTSKGYLLGLDLKQLDPQSFERRLIRLKDVLAHPNHQGKVPVALHITTEDDCLVRLSVPAAVHPSDDLAAEIGRVFSGNVSVRTT